MRFAFVVPFRNCKKFLRQTSNSIINQNYQNWIAIFRDDCSDDGGLEEVSSDPRIRLERTDQRMGGLANVHAGIMGSGLSPDDIVCIVDGDDYLTRNDALDIIHNLYSRTNCLLSYGQYETKDTKSGHCHAYNPSSFSKLRSGGFVASHLKTFRYSLYVEAMNQDPSCERYMNNSGSFLEMAWDVAIMTPLLEIAGFERVAFNPEVVYHYRTYENNEHNIDSKKQQESAKISLSKSPMKKVKI